MQSSLAISEISGHLNSLGRAKHGGSAPRTYNLYDCADNAASGAPAAICVFVCLLCGGGASATLVG